MVQAETPSGWFKKYRIGRPVRPLRNTFAWTSGHVPRTILKAETRNMVWACTLLLQFCVSLAVSVCEFGLSSGFEF